MKRLLYILLILVSGVCANAQDETESFDFGIAIVPQYAFASTMRLDFDFTFNKKNTLTIAPMFSFARHSSLLFSNQDDSYYYMSDEIYPEDISLSGAGLKLMVRHFFGDFNKNTGIYLGGGLHYRYSQVEYEIEDLETIIVDDDRYLVYGSVDKEENFNQVGVDFVFGYQMYLIDNIYGDVFAGWGFRISDSNDENEEYWDETVFDIAYSGYTPLAGLRIGMLF